MRWLPHKRGMRSIGVIGLGLALGILSATVGAHHPLNVYRHDERQTLIGSLAGFEARNPHSLLYFDVKNESGESVRWTVEWISALQLRREGIVLTVLKAGDQLELSGYPSRDPGEHRLWLRTIRRPSDGWNWSGGF